jgi:DNA-binding CsgD family transcriptional regulator
MSETTTSQFDYNRFVHFFETYKSQGFRNINPDDPIVLSLEEKMNNSGQFFFILDLIQLTGLYYSKSAYSFFGTQPGQMDPAVVYKAVHPDDIIRFSNARAKLIKLGMDIFNNPQNKMCLSTNFRIKNNTGKYVDLLFQEYIYFSENPYKSSYTIQVHTNVTGMISFRYGYHYYVGSDLSYFRYPDKDYLKIGNIFTKREWEIIKHIANGLESDQIAEKLYLSVHTINRHRQNILNKTRKKTTHDLVIELQERGLI